MKILKITLIALITVFTFSAANAQVRLKATIGNPPPHRRVVVVHHPYHRRVVVAHHQYRRPYYRHH